MLSANMDFDALLEHLIVERIREIQAMITYNISRNMLYARIELYRLRLELFNLRQKRLNRNYLNLKGTIE